MPTFVFSCRLGPRIEVYRGQSRPLHIDDGAIHVRRRSGYRNVPVLVRRAAPSYSSALVVPRFSSSAIARPRYRSLSPSPEPRPRIIEVEPSDECVQRYRDPAPAPEAQPRQHIHSHFHQQIPAPVPVPVPVPAPAEPPPVLVNPLGERVESLAARNAVLEVEMRELREQVRAAGRVSRRVEEVQEEEEVLALARARVRAGRRCRGGCGYLAGACRCAVSSRWVERSGSGSGRRGRWVDWD